MKDNFMLSGRVALVAVFIHREREIEVRGESQLTHWHARNIAGRGTYWVLNTVKAYERTNTQNSIVLTSNEHTKSEVRRQNSEVVIDRL